MRLKPERQEAFKMLFGNPMSLNLVVEAIEEQGFRKLPEGETVLQYWTKLFGDKGKQESIALLNRVLRYKNYDYENFKKRFSKYMN